MKSINDITIKSKSSDEDCLRIVNMNYEYSIITSLDGIEKYKNLKRLELTGNEIKDLSPLKYLTKLEELRLSDNLIEDITVLKDLTNLEILLISGNKIKDITPLKKLTNLISLRLAKNIIESLEGIEDLVNLKVLRIRENKISKLDPIEKLVNLNFYDFNFDGNPCYSRFTKCDTMKEILAQVYIEVHLNKEDDLRGKAALIHSGLFDFKTN